jgi:hypothetical protein
MFPLPVTVLKRMRAEKAPTSLDRLQKKQLTPNTA